MMMLAKLENAITLLTPSFVKRKIEGRPYLQKILGNTIWLVADRILRMGLSLVVGVWVGRYLGPEQFGALNFASAFVALFGVLASLGLDGIVIRDIVREPEHKYEILSSTFLLKLCGGGIAFIVSLAAILVMRPADSQTHWLVGIIAFGMIFQAFDAIDLWFQSQTLSKYAVLAKNVAFVILSVVKVILILNHASIIAFAYAALAEIIIGGTGLVFFYVRQHSLTTLWYPKIDIAKRLLKESLPAILSGFAIMIYMRIDQVMLEQMSGNREVGLYSAALKFSEIWYMIPSLIVSSVRPSLTEAKQESESKYYQQLQRLCNMLVKIAYAIALPMTFAATFIVTLFYGEAYKEAGIILGIHIWAAIFVFIGGAMSIWFVNEGLIKYTLIQTIVGAVMNVALNIVLLPRYGGVGAAIATVISYGFAAYLCNALTRKTMVAFKIQTKALFLIRQS